MTGDLGTVTTDRSPVGAMRGFRPAILELEVRRLLRNRRTLLFSIVVPAVFFLIFGLNSTYVTQRAGLGNTSAVVMISLALYGAVLATTSGGAMVSIERATGWSRQLRITPLTPAAYVGLKMISSLVLAAASVFTVYVIGMLTGKPSMPVHIWITTGVAVWFGSLLFAAFGLFVGYLLPSENVMQILGFALMLFSFGGGLFIPLSQFSHPLRMLASFTPLYGLNQLVHYPLASGPFHWAWALNVAVWFALFAAGAIWRFRNDTDRV
jgi:ABC-2 type transport system permease protein